MCGKSASKGDEPVHLYFSVRAHGHRSHDATERATAALALRGATAAASSLSSTSLASDPPASEGLDVDPLQSLSGDVDSTVSLGSEDDLLDDGTFVESDDPKVLLAKLEMLEQENFERMRMLRQREEQVEELKRKNADLKREMSRSMQQMASEVDTLRRQLSEERRSPGMPRASSPPISASSVSAVAVVSAGPSSDALELLDAREKVRTLERAVETARLDELALKHQIQEKSWNISVLEQRLGLANFPSAEFDPLRLKGAYEELSLLEATIYAPQAKFKSKRPVSALQLFNALVEWQAFDSAPPHESLMDKVVVALQASALRGNEDARSLALATCSSLLFLIRSKLQVDVLHSAPTETPLSRFVDALRGVLSDSFSMLLDCIYNELDRVVVQAFLEQPQLQLLSLAASGGAGARPGGASASVAAAAGVAGGGAGGERMVRSISAATSVVPVLNRYAHLLLRQHHHFEGIVRQFFTQVVRFIDASLFNALMSQRELCTCGNGFQTKVELSRLEEWIKESLQYPLRNEMEFTLQASTLLVVEKRTFAQEGAVEAVCPRLNYSQVLKLLQLFTPDQVAPEPVPPEVFSWISAKLKNAPRGALLLQPKLLRAPLSFDFATSSG